MLSSRELFLLIIVASTANAAPQVSALAGLPACASLGAISAITASGCGTTDLPCACNSPIFKTQFLAAATQNCSPADLATAETLSQQACAQAGVPVSTDSTTAVSDTPGTTPAPAPAVAANTDSASSISPTVEADVGDAMPAAMTADPADPADPAATATSTTSMPMLGEGMTTTAPYAMGNGTMTAQCTACSCSTSSISGVATFKGAAPLTVGKSRAREVVMSMLGLMALMAFFE